MCFNLGYSLPLLKLNSIIVLLIIIDLIVMSQHQYVSNVDEIHECYKEQPPEFSRVYTFIDYLLYNNIIVYSIVDKVLFWVVANLYLYYSILIFTIFFHLMIFSFFFNFKLWLGLLVILIHCSKFSVLFRKYPSLYVLLQKHGMQC